MKLRNLCAGLIATLALLTAVPSQAAMILAGNIGGVLFCASDNNAGCANGIQLLDVDPTPGNLALNQAVIGGLAVFGSLQQSVIGVQDILNSSSLSITNNTGATVNAQLAVGATGFTPPTDSIFTAGSGTWQNALGSNVNMFWYADLLNRQGAENVLDLPGVLLASFLDSAGGGVDAFSTSGGPFPFAAGNPFSMTLGMNMNLAAGGSLISRGQNQITEFTPVPEPGSMFLLGSGVLVGLRKFRQRKNAAK